MKTNIKIEENKVVNLFQYVKLLKELKEVGTKLLEEHNYSFVNDDEIENMNMHVDCALHILDKVYATVEGGKNDGISLVGDDFDINNWIYDNWDDEAEHLLSFDWGMSWIDSRDLPY